MKLFQSKKNGLLADDNILNNSIGGIINQKSVYAILMGASSLLSIMALWFTTGRRWNYYLFGIEGDTFGDFFNTLNQMGTQFPYVPKHSVYPALANMFYSLLVHFVDPVAYTNGLKYSISSLTIFILYNVITVAIFTLLMNSWLSIKKSAKIFLIFSTLLSAPFIYQFERANIVFVALLFLMIFMIYKDHKSGLMREVSLLALAVSSVIKIYPIIFSILLLKKRRYGDFIRTITYTIILFILPFYYYGGLHNIFVMISNIQHLTQLSTNFSPNLINFTNTIEFLYVKINMVIISQEILSRISYFMFFASLVSAYYIKEEWKTTLLLTTLIAAIPGFTNMYGLIYMVIPLVLMFNEQGSSRRMDIIYSFLVFGTMGIFIFLPDGPFEVYRLEIYRYNITTFIKGFSLIILLFLLNIELITHKIKLWHKRASAKKVK